MPYVRQTNFSGGVLSPQLWGRTDLARHATGLRTLTNFFVSRHGAAVSRPGTTFVHLTGSNAGVRLVPFIYSDTQSYALEFGELYVRFHSNGGTVVWATWSGASLYDTDDHVTYAGATYRALRSTLADQPDISPLDWVQTSATTQPMEVTTPWGATDLGGLCWAQVGDVMTITCPGFAPRELYRTSHQAWGIRTVTVALGSPTTLLGGTEYVRLQAPIAAGTASEPEREWTWVVTELHRTAATGVVTETGTYTVTQDTAPATLPATIAVYQDIPQTLVFSATASSTLIAYRVYRGRGGLFGWVGDATLTAGAGTFTDVGAEPDYALPPPSGFNPFTTSGTTENPRAVAFYQERRVFGGTQLRPATMFFSETGNYSNFDERYVPIDSQALVFELAARRREEVRAMVGLEKLIVLTNGSAWQVSGAAGEPLKPDSVDASVICEVGSKKGLPPVVIDNSVLFCRSKGNGVRALVARDGRSSHVAVDVSTQSDHLFVPNDIDVAPHYFGAAPQSAAEIVDWCYAEDPWGVVWAVRADGKLLSLTYSEASEVWAWAEHETDGYVMSICSVPEGDEDAVYIVTERQLYGSSASFSVERMTSRVQTGGLDDDICLDCAFEWTDVPSLTLTGLTAFADRDDVWVIGKDNPPVGPLSVDSSGNLTLPELPTANDGSDVTLWVGLKFTPEMQTLDVAGEGRMRQSTVVSVGFEVVASRGLQVGPDFDHLVDWEMREVATGYGVISNATQIAKVNVRGTWGNSRACLRQTEPLPVTVVGVTRELDVGG